MPQKSLEEMLEEIKREREACEKVIVQLRILAEGSVVQVLETIFQGVMEQSMSASVEHVIQTVRELNNEQMQLSISVHSAAAARLSELTENLNTSLEQAKQLKLDIHQEVVGARKIQRWSISMGFSVVIGCGLLMGWTSYGFWLIQHTTASVWFQKIVVDNMNVLNQCLKPEVIRHNRGNAPSSCRLR